MSGDWLERARALGRDRRGRCTSCEEYREDCSCAEEWLEEALDLVEAADKVAAAATRANITDGIDEVHEALDAYRELRGRTS